MSLHWREYLRLGLPLPIIAGAEELRTEVGTGEGSGEAAVLPGEGYTPSDGLDAQTYEIDGQTLTADQLREALNSHANKQSWERSYKQRDQAMAAVKGTLERVFGRPIEQLTQMDLIDLQAFGVLNEKLRTDPAFAQAWKETLTQMYQKAGMTRGQAQAAAASDVAEAKAAPAPPQIPPELQQRLDRVEGWAVTRELRELGDFVEGSIAKAITRAAADLPEWHDPLREQVLYSLLGYDDAELLRLATTGELTQIIADATKQATQRIKQHTDRALKSRGEAVERGRQAGTQPPMRGGTAVPATGEPVAEPGKGLSRMHTALRKALGGS